MEPMGKVKPARRFRFVTKNALKRLGVFFGLIGVMFVWTYFALLLMPGRTFSGDLPPATDRQKELAAELNGHVTAWPRRSGCAAPSSRGA
jgi:hypothetical protein